MRHPRPSQKNMLGGTLFQRDHESYNIPNNALSPTGTPKEIIIRVRLTILPLVSCVRTEHLERMVPQQEVPWIPGHMAASGY